MQAFNIIRKLLLKTYLFPKDIDFVQKAVTTTAIVLLVMTGITLSLQAHAENYTIPSWVKKNAKWWSDGSVGDRDFVQGIQYLIQKGIMKIPQTKSSDSQSSQKIPQWIKTNAGWWADDKISDDDFVSGIQYLISKGIMKVGPMPTPSKDKCTGYYC